MGESVEAKVEQSNSSCTSDEVYEYYNEELRKLQQDACDHLKRVLCGIEKTKVQLEMKRKDLEMYRKELEKREVRNENEMMKLNNEKNMIENAASEQKKADENVLKLAEKQKREKERHYRRIIELEEQLAAKQNLELEIEQMRGALEVMKHMGEDGDIEVLKKMDSIQKQLNQKEKMLDAMEAMNQALIGKECRSNEVLQEARNELIIELMELSSGASIGIKRMGDFDHEPFPAAIKRKYFDEELRDRNKQYAYYPGFPHLTES